MPQNSGAEIAFQHGVELHELLMTAVRAVGVYVLMLVVIRLTGKRTVGNFTAFDLLVALMLGEVVDEMIYGDVTFMQGSVAIVVVAGMKSLTAWLSYSSHRMEKVLEGEPVLVVKDGELQRDGLRKERLNELDVYSLLRLEGIEDIKEVRLAFIENDGEMSIIRQEWAQPLQKGDLEDKSRKRVS
jgi:uncharacterized membrane protein YcaP (DUF421 family)